MRLGLALSGGGLRATLFHLGVVKALQQRRMLQDVRHITSVSGGSILAAHLVKNWSAYLDPVRFDTAAKEIIDFARLDVRGRIFRRLMLPQYYLLPYQNLRHFRFRRDGTVRNLLFEKYLKGLLGEATLDELAAENPGAPRLDILTTNLTRGSLAYFTGEIFVPSDDEDTPPITTRTSAARAVMTSALFPAVFPTIELNSDNLMTDSSLFPQPEYFTDGGVFDNLGIRRFQRILDLEEPTIDRILVCDASGAFDWLVERETLGYWKTALRSTDILMKRLADLEYEVARTAPNLFTFVRISDVVEEPQPHELPVMVQRQIKNVRTDLDKFNDTEIDSIVQHGYSVAGAKLDELCGAAASPQEPWTPLPGRQRPEESIAIRLLRRARFHSKNLLRWNDWASYVYPTVLAIGLSLAAMRYDSRQFDRYYETLSIAEQQLIEPLRKPEMALEELAAAVEESPVQPDTVLHMATVGYSLWINKQAPRELFDRALKRLEPRERARFEELRWRRYFEPLDKTTFGTPSLSDARGSLEFIADAVPYVGPDLQVETALTSYGALMDFNAAEGDKNAAKALADRAFSLLERAVGKFDRPDVEKRLSETNRFRARLLKGHYQLEVGFRAKDDPSAAEEWFCTAARTYSEARTIGVVREYWKVEYNTCNALNEAAGAAQRYRDQAKLTTAEEIATANGAIASNLDQALDRCRKAEELAPPKNWQPTYLVGLILFKKNELEPAATSLLHGYHMAQESNEQERYAKSLKEEPVDLRPLCRNREFNGTFVRICRRTAAAT